MELANRLNADIDSDSSYPPTPSSNYANDLKALVPGANGTNGTNGSANGANGQDAALLALASMETKKRKRVNTEDESNPRHKWLSTAGIKDLEKSGHFIQKGQFTRSEEIILRSNVTKFFTSRGLDEKTELFKYLRQKKHTPKLVSKDEKLEFLKEIAVDFPSRVLNQIYDKLERLYNPLNVKKEWSASDKKKLCDLVKEHGKEWQTIGSLIGRLPENCRTLYRNLEESGLVDADEEEMTVSPKAALWTRDETWALFKAVCEVSNFEIPEIISAEFLNSLIDLFMDKKKQGAYRSKLPYKAITLKFNTFENVRKRNSNQVRLRWQSNIVPNLKSIVDFNVDNYELDFDEFIDLMEDKIHGSRKEQNNMEFDVVLVESIKQNFPSACFMRDIKWNNLLLLPQFEKMMRYRLQQRFMFLCQKFFKGTQFEYHTTFEELPVPSGFVPLYDGYDYLLENIVKKDKALYNKSGAGQILTPAMIFETL